MGLTHSTAMRCVQSDSMTDIDVQTILLLPRVVRQLTLEAENLERRIKQGEKNGNIPKSELTMMWMDTITKKDLVKSNSGISYETPFDISRNERAMIIKLFKDCAGYSWSRNFGWIGQGLAKGRLEVEVFEASPTVYDGIIARRTATSGDTLVNVVRLDLSGVGCMGELPDSLSALEECTFLCLNWNLIFGNLPNRFGNMTKLMHLDLSGNGLSGSLDVESFSQFNALRTLNLSFNAFDGPIPDAFHRMSKLAILNLSGNCLSGELPPSLSRLTELQELKLYSNQLIGAIPSTMSALQNLEKVNLSQNRFTSGLSAFNSCAKLRTLELSENLLRGHIEMSVIGLRRLDLLYLQHNRISGIIPPELCILVRLQRLNLSHNNIRGVLPHNIGELINLETLMLGGNNITGPVPTSISMLTKLRDFNVFKNYPAEISMQPMAFSQQAFQRIYCFGPSVGINSMHWDFEQVYGRPRNDTDNDSVTLFSGLL